MAEGYEPKPFSSSIRSTNTQDLNVPHNTITTVCTLTNVPAGTYIITLTAAFRASNPDGSRAIVLDDNIASDYIIEECQANDYGWTTINGSTLRKYTTSTTVELRVIQRSGTSMLVGGWLDIASI